MAKVAIVLYNKIDYLKFNQVAAVSLARIILKDQQHLEDHNNRKEKKIRH